MSETKRSALLSLLVVLVSLTLLLVALVAGEVAYDVRGIADLLAVVAVAFVLVGVASLASDLAPDLGE